MTTEEILEMWARQRGAELAMQEHRDEIERATANAKRTAWDRWWRRRYYRETASWGRG